eukprot:4088591-Amphidinium_carterae.2
MSEDIVELSCNIDILCDIRVPTRLVTLRRSSVLTVGALKEIGVQVSRFFLLASERSGSH